MPGGDLHPAAAAPSAARGVPQDLQAFIAQAGARAQVQDQHIQAHHAQREQRAAQLGGGVRVQPPGYRHHGPAPVGAGPHPRRTHRRAGG
jgi:hypothetical protein